MAKVESIGRTVIAVAASMETRGSTRGKANTKRAIRIKAEYFSM
ncbi:MAG TPA: hypothetical protein VI389_00245 [Geobacteraceae bacterium]